MFCGSCGKDIPSEGACPYCDPTPASTPEPVPSSTGAPAEKPKKKNTVLWSVVIFLVGMLVFYLLTRLAMITRSSSPIDPTTTIDSTR